MEATIMNDKSFIEKLIHFLQITSQLKTTLRSTQITECRKESTADHSWRLALLVILVQPFLDVKIDTARALKMAIIHDLAEAVVGDITILDLLNDNSLMIKKFESEFKVFTYFKMLLGEEIGNEIFSIWEEFEKNESYEAKTVNALDKLEAQLQQNESKLNTWKEIEKTGKLEYLESFCEFDSFILDLKNKIKSKREE